MEFINQNKEIIKETCKNLPIKKLSIFGSAITNNFHKESDVDMLIEFIESESLDYFEAYFLIKQHMEDLLNRKIDLSVNKNFKNPYFAESLKNNILIYEKRN